MYEGNVRRLFLYFRVVMSTAFRSGKEYRGKTVKELCELTGITKTRTTPFHPQCDGQTERMNQTLLQILRTTADENPASWPQRLPTIMSAYRMTIHKVTGVTLNMAMFG